MITNPVVRRSLSQARLVLNALLREYGMPDAINVELARDLSRSKQERTKIEKDLKENTQRWTDAEDLFRELIGRSSKNRSELKRFLLAKEQNWQCPYSGEKIDPVDSVDQTSAQVDHIIPFSLSWDDSQNNQVLVKTWCNQEKGNQTPHEWKGNTDETWWLAFEARVSGYPLKKRQRLLRKSFDDATSREWKNRNLNDTRYICREFMNHVEKNLGWPSDNHRHVFARKGAHTAHLRYLWGLSKDREKDVTHHALDALVVACSTEGQIQAMEGYFKGRELGTSHDKFLFPLEDSRADVLEAIKNIFVSRAPNRKVYGPIHKDTMRSERQLSNGNRIVIEKMRLDKDFGKKHLNNIFEAFNEDGTPGRNYKLYEAVKNRLEHHGWDGKEAFSNPLYMPTNNGSQGPQIRGVKVVTTEKGGVYVNNRSGARRGIASRGEIVRVDVFRKSGKYRFVPVYLSDFAHGVLPMRAIRGNKEDSWIQVGNDSEFLFSLFKNDLLEFAEKNEPIQFAYFKGLDRSDGRMSLLSPQSTKKFRVSPGQLTLLKRYVVDPIGHKFLIRKEKRHGVACCFGRKSGKTEPERRAANS